MKSDELGVAAALPRRILMVTNNGAHGELCSRIEAAGFSARGVRDVADVPQVVAQWRPTVVLVDANLSGGAAQVIDSVRAVHAAAVCVLLVDAACGRAVTDALLCKADTLLPWPVDVVALGRLLALTEAPRTEPAATSQLPTSVIGRSGAMAEVWRRVILAAQTRASLLISGETGVGKEVIARAVHRFSPRRRGPFIAVNCAALPETLLEAELFGYEAGAFTGASRRHKGRFELAQGGTLFLDEIGDLPLVVQVKLLRVLQERSFERLGGTESIPVDVRVISATHRDLDAASNAGSFRLDLFYRLNVIALQVPPLRERPEDVLELWDSFLSQQAREEDRKPPQTTPAARSRLLRHDWPGNVRELQNAAQHALTVATSDVVDEDSLPSTLLAPRRTHVMSLVGLTLKEIERLAILQTYDALGSIDATAQALGISARTIHYRLRDYRSQTAVVVAARAKVPSALRVLLAEDDDDLRGALTEFLRGEGLTVVAVADGDAALAHLHDVGDAPPDLLVTDVRMPRVNGIELLEGVRARGLGLPVIVMSAFGDGDTRDRALALGATSFLAKPVDINDLQRAIRALSPAAWNDDRRLT